jgi:molybdopterin molybdotransferase
LGLVAANDLVAAIDVPPFDNSAMDGYAVLAAECQVGEPVCFVSSIATGMPLPDGADAVVPWESVNDGVLEKPVSAGDFIRSRGHDVESGSVVVGRGAVLDPVMLAAAASVGLPRIDVHRRPSVGVLVTGDEIADPGKSLEAGQVYDSNSTLLPLLLQSAGAQVVLEREPDDIDAISAALQRLSQMADVIVTTGGASVGERDWVRSAVERDGTVDLWKVAVRPGKPFGAGTIASTPVLMLPGNPGSVLACAHAFVMPVVRRLAGRKAQAPTARAVLSDAVSNLSDRHFLCPVRLEGTSGNGSTARPLVGMTSQGIFHAAGLSGFIVVEPGKRVDAGTEVEVELAS